MKNRTEKETETSQPDLLAFLRTPEARKRLAEDEAGIHRRLIARARERNKKYRSNVTGLSRIIR